MKCLRCGYCCCFLDVIIISPAAIKSDGSVDFEDENNYEYKPCNIECPHLKWEDNLAICSIHEFPWFVDTPCHAYTQVGKAEVTCRMGKYVLDKGIDVRAEVIKRVEAIL